MNTARPGNILLSGHAYGENTRTVPGKPRSVILDVYLFGAPDEEDNKIACSLHFFKSDEALVFTEGLYDVMANITVFSYSCNVTYSPLLVTFGRLSPFGPM